MSGRRPDARHERWIGCDRGGGAGGLSKAFVRFRFRVLAVLVLACLSAPVLGPATAGAATPLGPQVGLSAGHQILSVPDAERQAELNFAAATGAKWFGLDLDWSRIQPQRGVWNWGPADTVVRQVRERGMQIIGTLAYSPAWAVPATCPAGNTHCFPAQVEDFAQFRARGGGAVRPGQPDPRAAGLDHDLADLERGEPRSVRRATRRSRQVHPDVEAVLRPDQGGRLLDDGAGRRDRAGTG